MVRQTRESLQARASSLSLRLQAMEGASASTTTSTSSPTMPTLFSNSPHSARPQPQPASRSSKTIPRETRRTVGKPESYTKPFCDFLAENPTVFHTVDHFKTKLSDAGFKELPPRDSWAGKLTPGGKYWTTRNGSSLIAFTVGSAYKPGNGVAMIAGHVDALTARLKPVSTKRNAAGYVQLGVAPYAGALNQTWWDRDLSIGGRVVVRESSGKTRTRLVKLGWPIARIPTLAPHFGVGMMGQNNPETQAVPIIGLDNSDLSSADAAPETPLGPAGAFVNTQPPKLVKLISAELGLDSPSSIVDWELELFDSQPAQTGGLDREFIFAGRIDDKLCSWAALTGLLEADQAEDDGTVKLVALFDDEEIGSLLRQGARGNLLPSTIERLVEALTNEAAASGASSPPEYYGPGVLGRTYANSFLLSADVTHAGNPNFLAYYLDQHVPRLNVGLAICADSNGHLTTDAVSTAILRRVAELSGSQVQVFQIRNDTRSGGTVGPMLSSAMGVRAADAGLPQLSMHSIRATTGALDPGLGVKFFKGFLDHWEKIDREWQ
ncbi:aminopeptidase I zinc metalloprotease [Plectosphaerella plurivora]|uniref:Aminopeptidase I zinc metalloprotease n=1 Tax=Plectosphaerella plurivora TaxID=936078 RepID=A0A9P8VHS2_9PEZI|nr:aminopeptidase I zinc metalloprotease [Plectosphaerella plurivora]